MNNPGRSDRAHIHSLQVNLDNAIADLYCMRGLEEPNPAVLARKDDANRALRVTVVDSAWTEVAKSDLQLINELHSFAAKERFESLNLSPRLRGRKTLLSTAESELHICSWGSPSPNRQRYANDPDEQSTPCKGCLGRHTSTV